MLGRCRRGLPAPRATPPDGTPRRCLGTAALTQHAARPSRRHPRWRCVVSVPPRVLSSHGVGVARQMPLPWMALGASVRDHHHGAHTPRWHVTGAYAGEVGRPMRGEGIVAREAGLRLRPCFWPTPSCGAGRTRVTIQVVQTSRLRSHLRMTYPGAMETPSALSPGVWERTHRCSAFPTKVAVMAVVMRQGKGHACMDNVSAYPLCYCPLLYGRGFCRTAAQIASVRRASKRAMACLSLIGRLSLA